MDCAKLHEDIAKLETIQAKFSSELESATGFGLGKTILDGLYQEASTTSESLLEQYAYDLVEQNLKDESGRNTAFLNSVLERYWKEQAEQSRQANLAEPNTANRETADSPEFIITNDTTIDKVRANLTEYLRVDKKLDSNLLAYAVKERLGLLKDQSQSPEQIDNTPLRTLEELYKDLIPDSIKDQTLPRLAYLYKIAERLKNLETLETDHYIFMLPKDKWNEGKMKLPNPENNPEAPEYIAPTDLTAILKSEVYYDWNHETGEPNGHSLVYDEKWVGKEIRHFPWSKELIEEANKKLLKPNGYHIPESWNPIVDSIRAKIANRQRTEPEEVTDEQIITTLLEDLNLAFSGRVSEGNPIFVGSDGYFWSASPIFVGSDGYFWYAPGSSSSSLARCLHSFSAGYVGPETAINRSDAVSVRCVA